jgi:hypothetical protein
LAAISEIGFGWVIDIFMRNELIPSQREHKKNTQEKIKRRMELQTERHDLIEGFMKKQDQIVSAYYDTATHLHGARD